MATPIDPFDVKPTGPSKIPSNFQGIPITLEWKKGQRKESEDSTYGYYLYADYGYINKTISNEETEELDVYIGPDKDSEKAFYFELLDDEGCLNETKVLLGFKSLKAAQDCMNLQYGSWKLGAFTETSIKDLKENISLEEMKNGKEKRREAEEEAAGQPILTVPIEQELNEYGQAADQPTIIIQV